MAGVITRVVGLGSIALMLMVGAACRRPIDELTPPIHIALIALYYDPVIYGMDPHGRIDANTVYVAYSGKPQQRAMHYRVWNDFINRWMIQTQAAGIDVTRPLNVLDTSLMHESSRGFVYEYLLDPYDPIDSTNHAFMAGLAQRLGVDAVAIIAITWGLDRDEQLLWNEYADPYNQPLPSVRQQLQMGYETSVLHMGVTMTVIDRSGQVRYTEKRTVGTPSDGITVDDRDLQFDGGVSPKLLAEAVNRWLVDWSRYLPNRPNP
jgi:hypothetical protein